MFVKNRTNKIRILQTAVIFAAAFFVMLFILAESFAAEYKEPEREKLTENGCALLEITTAGYETEEIERDEWKRITYTLTYDSTVISDCGASIKGRGNYTWTQEKKPYAVKCDEKTDWFGFGKAKDWVLLAESTDQTHLRNYAAFRLAREFGFDFTPECRHAHVIINGEYKGLYLITEKVEIDKERVVADVEGGDCLAELDNSYGSSTEPLFKSTLGNRYVMKDPDENDYEKGGKMSQRSAFVNVQNKINKFEQKIKSRSSFDEIGACMDLDSLVDWYIFNEIAKNDDSLFNSSIFIYNDYDGMLHMGPVWDYDLAFGGIDRNDGKNIDPEGFLFTEDYWGRPNWFDYLLDRPFFVKMVKERWQELYSSGIFDRVAEDVESIAAITEREYYYDMGRWKNDGVFVKAASYGKAAEKLIGFYRQRIAWLNTQWNETGATPAPKQTDTPEKTPSHEQKDTPKPSETPESLETSGNDHAPENSGETNGCGSSGGGMTVLIAAFAAAILMAGRKKKRLQQFC